MRLVAFGFKTEATPCEVEPALKEYSTSSPLSFVSLSLSLRQMSSHLLAHMEHDGKSFHKTKPSPAPIIRVSCRVITENHVLYGHSLTKKPKKTSKDGLADTGAQVCTAGPDLLTSLHIDREILIPTKLEVKGITHLPITMLGALFLEISANGMHTKQIVYIAREARSLILSETALKDLGALPPDFPTAGAFKQIAPTTWLSVLSSRRLLLYGLFQLTFRGPTDSTNRS